MPYFVIEKFNYFNQRFFICEELARKNFKVESCFIDQIFHIQFKFINLITA